MLDLELISAFEVSLADARADEAHPAFQNLFIGAEWQAGHQALVFERKPRLAHDKGVLAAHFMVAEAERRRPAEGAGQPAALARPNRGPSHPLAAFDDPRSRPRAATRSARHRARSGRAFAVRLQIAPGGWPASPSARRRNSHSTLRAVRQDRQPATSSGRR